MGAPCNCLQYLYLHWKAPSLRQVRRRLCICSGGSGVKSGVILQTFLNDVAGFIDLDSGEEGLDVEADQCVRLVDGGLVKSFECFQ